MFALLQRKKKILFLKKILKKSISNIVCLCFLKKTKADMELLEAEVVEEREKLSLNFEPTTFSHFYHSILNFFL